MNPYGLRDVMNQKIFDLYTDYLISSTYRRTATGLSDILDGDISHDQVSQFFFYRMKTMVRKNSGVM